MPAKPAKKTAKKVEAPKKALKKPAVAEAPKKTAKAPAAPVEKPLKAAKAPKAAAPAAEPVVEAPKAKKAKAVAAPVAAPVPETPKAEPKVLGKKEKKPKPEKIDAPKSGKPLDEEGEKLLKQWHQMQEQLKSVKPPLYTLQGNFDAKTPIQHKVLGWGYVLKNKGNRIEVLFQDGVKTLVTNYKPT